MNISNYLRNYTIMQTYGRCAYCGCSILDSKNKVPAYGATFDHVLPVVKGGATSKENLKLCCFNCNQAKGSLSLEEFREKRLEELQRMVKQSGLAIKATGSVTFFFERLEQSGLKDKIEELLNGI